MRGSRQGSGQRLLVSPIQIGSRFISALRFLLPKRTTFEVSVGIDSFGTISYSGLTSKSPP